MICMAMDLPSGTQRTRWNLVTSSILYVVELFCYLVYLILWYCSILYFFQRASNDIRPRVHDIAKLHLSVGHTDLNGSVYRNTSRAL